MLWNVIDISTSFQMHRHSRVQKMIKGILFCVCFLFAQLFVLSYIDHRLGHSESATRQATTVQNNQRQRDADEEAQA